MNHYSLQWPLDFASCTIGVICRLYRDNGKEDGNCRAYNRVYVGGILE